MSSAEVPAAPAPAPAAADAADDVFDMPAAGPIEATGGGGGGGGVDDGVLSEDEATVGPDGGPPAKNALEHSIRKRGAHSYYYAHAGPTGPGSSGPSAPVVYDEAPRLLEKVSLAATPPVVRAEPFTTYSWADFKKKAKVYIPLPGAASLPEAAVALEWGPQTFSVTVRVTPTLSRVLRIAKLSDKISGASVVRKDDQLVVSLDKDAAQQFTWYDLASKS